jgi:hypothetical protein
MTSDPRATEACLKLLDALIEGVSNLDSIGAVDQVQLHTTAQVEAWLREEREIAATAVLDGLPAHEHPASAADAYREIDRLRALLTLAEQHARDTQDELVPEAADEAYQRGLADGRAQATEGWRREWAMDLGLKGAPLHPWGSEAEARRGAKARAGRTAVSRLVGPWEPAEQTEGDDR